MTYFPRLSTRPFELMAYERLDAEIKDSITPVVALSRSRRATSFVDPMGTLLEASAGRRVIVEFDPEPKVETSAQEAELLRSRKWERSRRPGALKDLSARQLEHHATLRDETAAFNAELTTFLHPVDGGTRWIGFVQQFANAVPVVQHGTNEAVESQVALANANRRPMAFICHADSAIEIETVRRGIELLEDPTGSILLVDARHDRGTTAASVARVDAALRGLRLALGDAFAAIEKVSLAGSFPASSLRELPRVLGIEERAVFEAVRGSWDVAYGDHASIQRRMRRAGGSGWFPHVDLAMDREWRIHLTERNSDPTGYVESASDAMASPAWAGRSRCWGSEMIELAAGGNLHPPGVTLTIPGPWLGVRANQHMTRQARLAGHPVAG